MNFEKGILLLYVILKPHFLIKMLLNLSKNQTKILKKNTKRGCGMSGLKLVF